MRPRWWCGQTMRKIDESSADTLKINQEINLQNELGLCFTISLFFRSYKSPSWLHWRRKHAISFKGFSIAAVKFVISASSRAITLSLLQSNIRSSEEVAIMSLRSPHNVRNADSSAMRKGDAGNRLGRVFEGLESMSPLLHHHHHHQSSTGCH